MHRFNYNFLKNGYLPASVVQYSLDIGSTCRLQKERQKEFSKVFEKLRKKAVVESVKSSNAIEQIVTTDQRITEIVNGSKPLTHDEEEIAGYLEALNAIHTYQKDMQFNEATIKHLHKMLYSKSFRQVGGAYKTEDNLILQYDSYGNNSVRFKPVSAQDCNFCMEQLVLAYTDARQNGIPDLVLIPCVILDFLCIHPFPDANGRVSRLLTLLLYYRAGLDVGKYVSLENQIMETKDYYYEALYESSKGWNENENSYVPFINYCMYVLTGCYNKLNRYFLNINRKRGSKSERVQSVISDSIVPISKEEICNLLPDVSTSTVQAKLNGLLNEGKIKKIGTYRNAKYK